VGSVSLGGVYTLSTARDDAVHDYKAFVLLHRTSHLSAGDWYYRVTFDTTGGSVPAADSVKPRSVKAGTAVFLPEPVKTGFYFGRWKKSAGAVLVQVGAIYYVGSNAAFITQWS